MSGRSLFKKLYFFVKIADKALIILPYRVRIVFFELLSGCPFILGVGMRYLLLNSLAAECGNNVYVGRWCKIKNFKNIRIGNNVSIHEYCYLDGKGGITIEDNVSIAHASSLVSFDHSYTDPEQLIKYQPLIESQIIIGTNVWIGCGVRVLAGASVAHRTVIAANCVVKGKLESGFIYGGVPAKVLKKI